MALHRLWRLSSLLRSVVSVSLRRNIGLSAVVFNKAKDLDPVQKLFLDKIREYSTKSKCVPQSDWLDSCSLSVVWTGFLWFVSQGRWRCGWSRSGVSEEPDGGDDQTPALVRRRRPHQVPRVQVPRWAWHDEDEGDEEVDGGGGDDDDGGDDEEVDGGGGGGEEGD